MSYKKGVITSIDASAPRDFGHGNTSINNLNIDGGKYTIFVSEKNGQCILKDKDYQEVRANMEVEFMFDETEKGNKIQWKTFKVLSSGSGAPQQVQQPVQNQSQERNIQHTTNDKRAFLEMTVFRGMAASMALIKLEGKQIPDSIEESIERLAKTYLNQSKK